MSALKGFIKEWAANNLGKAAFMNRDDIIQVGFNDLTPIWTYFTGASSPTLVSVNGGGGRKELAFAGSGSVEELWNKYHIPHEILLNIASYEFHLHLEHDTAAPTGAAKFYIDLYAALADGTFTGKTTFSAVFTPHATTNILKNNIVKVEGLTAAIAQLQPDSIFTLRIYRDSADVADTFTGNVIYHTGDFHLPYDLRLTTSKDFGSGWIKA